MTKTKSWPFLQQDRFYATYAIGDLEPDFFPQCEWFAAGAGGRIQALALHFTGLDPHALFTMGASDGLALILGSALRPERVYFTGRSEHLPAIQAFYSLGEVQNMLRMTVREEDFQPVIGKALKLGPGYCSELKRLYSLGESRGESVVAFSPYQLAQGVFYGIEQRGRLIAAAGTHLVAPTYGVAAVGNVFTDPDYRGRGYATLCTSAVTKELLSQGMDVVLNVQEGNADAIHIYEKLGYRQYCRFIEVLGVRKGLGEKANRRNHIWKEKTE
ncbi:MAG: GNAT family N-acetyltransferase [Anaerolineae bacterium]|nr:GNAT family N-acetyltransferase [Anaerolineae bacterium]